MKFLLLLMMITKVFAGVDPYKKKGTNQTPVCDNTYVELDNLPPVRDQGRYGTCYAHAAVNLLDYHRCAKSPSPVSCYQDKGSVLHLARFYKTESEDEIVIGGDAGTILARFQGSRKVAKESCATYEDWKKLDGLHRQEIGKLNAPSSERSEIDYFYFISNKINKGATYSEMTCFAQEIVDAGVQSNVNDILSILLKAKGSTWQELRYKILVPESCKNDQITYPDYKTVKYPNYNDNPTFAGFRNHIYHSLKAGAPVEASFCSSSNADGSCNYHSAVIVGQRHVCSLSKCELQFRIHNSYGKRWQEYNDNGWVNAENLSNLMMDKSYGLGVMTLLPKGQTLNKSTSAPYYENAPSGMSMTSLNAQGKESLNPSEKCYQANGSSYQHVEEEPEYPVAPSKPSTVIYSAPSIPGGSKTYVCKKAGQNNMYTDKPQAGWDCKGI